MQPVRKRNLQSATESFPLSLSLFCQRNDDGSASESSVSDSSSSGSDGLQTNRKLLSLKEHLRKKKALLKEKKKLEKMTARYTTRKKPELAPKTDKDSFLTDSEPGNDDDDGRDNTTQAVIVSETSSDPSSSDSDEPEKSFESAKSAEKSSFERTGVLQVNHLRVTDAQAKLAMIKNEYRQRTQTEQAKQEKQKAQAQRLAKRQEVETK